MPQLLRLQELQGESDGGRGGGGGGGGGNKTKKTLRRFSADQKIAGAFNRDKIL